LALNVLLSNPSFIKRLLKIFFSRRGKIDCQNPKWQPTKQSFTLLRRRFDSAGTSNRSACVATAARPRINRLGA
jgi:hypothetical protein